MGEFIGHECGVALLRLRQPLSYYRDRYDDPAWGLRKLYLLMEKQHNRGQDGAGVSAVKFDMPPGEKYLLRIRSSKHNAIERIFDVVMKGTRNAPSGGWKTLDEAKIKAKCEFVAEVYLGHLRYGTHSKNQVSNCHPLMRKNNTASRNLAIAGNFNMTNSAELFRQLVEYGLNPVGDSDTQVVLERLGYFLDREHDHLHAVAGPGSFRGLEGRELAAEIARELNIVRVLSKAAQGWDGGYLFAGLIGNGDSFVCRDPAGIRPGYFYVDEEVVAVASERAALTSVFDVEPDAVETVRPGHALVIKRDGEIQHRPTAEPVEVRQCTFERIYFSRGNDPAIYCERKALGRLLAPRVLDAIDHDVEHAVFSFIPNTAESAYVGLIEELDHLTHARRAEVLWEKIRTGSADRADLEGLLHARVRAEKIAHKDQRMRTFITHDQARRDLVLHIYDITRGVVQSNDTLVVLDDSIVRGTTLRESIITILSRLDPGRIIVLSSAPPIMYPDCYGIDMSQLQRFIAFEAAVALLMERGEEQILDEVEQRCLAQKDLPLTRMENHVAAIYDRFTLDELSAKVAQLVRPATIDWTGEIDVIYQSVEGLRHAMPAHTGDWYFTGRYPTPGGYRVLNRSYLNWRQQVDVRAY
ncbi:MAG: amidophosphoribosyltransferase [Planctomycetes bacterium]|nr:amidophosphoribosyltransferase [Planctomycetota bacterium]